MGEIIMQENEKKKILVVFDDRFVSKLVRLKLPGVLSDFGFTTITMTVSENATAVDVFALDRLTELEMSEVRDLIQKHTDSPETE